MNREEFDGLVRKVEAGVGRDHAALRRRAVLLAVVGYTALLAWFFFILLIAGAFFSSVFWADHDGKVFCVIIGLTVLIVGGWGALRMLVVKLAPPKGRTVRRDEAPVLFAALDDLRAQLRCSPFHRVLLTTDFNAGVVQSPRLGPLGWSRNYLILGLPLLDALSSDEMRAVLAHEFVHLSREHGRLSHWIYRLRRSWENFFQNISGSRPRGSLSLHPLTVKFVNWFWPPFNAHAFVLSRANEYEADAHAARMAGGLNLASALVRMQTLSRLLEQRLWPSLWRLSHQSPVPPDDLLIRLRDGLRTGAGPDDRARWLEEAFNTASTNSDTHPCLSERLRSLGISRNAVTGASSAASPSAAEALLVSSLVELRRDVQTTWVKDAAPQWREQHARAAALSHRISSLDQAVPAASTNIEALWDKTYALLNLRDDAAVEPMLRSILTLQADHALANYHLGRLLLEAGRSEGEAYLERALATNPDLVPQGCGVLHAHYRHLGRADQLQALSLRLDRHEKETVASRAERNEITAKDRLLPHGLSVPELAALRQVLSAEPELADAELAQKELKYFSNQRLFLLCVRRRKAWYGLADFEAERALARRLSASVRLPGRVVVFPPSGSFRALSKKLRQTADSPIWP